jgi:hypothetical protein
MGGKNQQQFKGGGFGDNGSRALRNSILLSEASKMLKNNSGVARL